MPRTSVSGPTNYRLTFSFSYFISPSQTADPVEDVLVHGDFTSVEEHTTDASKHYLHSWRGARHPPAALQEFQQRGNSIEGVDQLYPDHRRIHNKCEEARQPHRCSGWWFNTEDYCSRPCFYAHWCYDSDVPTRLLGQLHLLYGPFLQYRQSLSTGERRQPTSLRQKHIQLHPHLQLQLATVASRTMALRDALLPRQTAMTAARQAIGHTWRSARHGTPSAPLRPIRSLEKVCKSRQTKKQHPAKTKTTKSGKEPRPGWHSDGRSFCPLSACLGPPCTTATKERRLLRVAHSRSCKAPEGSRYGKHRQGAMPGGRCTKWWPGNPKLNLRSCLPVCVCVWVRERVKERARVRESNGNFQVANNLIPI